jgi:HAD superfamily hydrolase (TIGR01490 family)
MHLALFDFDGTITKRDTFVCFLIYAVSWPRLLLGSVLLLPLVLRFGLGLITNHEAKEGAISFFFAGMEEAEFQAVSRRFSRERLSAYLRPEALRRIEWHKQQGHELYVVSASIEHWLESWCREMGMKLICTGVEVVEGRLTGKLAGANCWGPEKVRRIREEIDTDSFEKIFAYGDSRGDREMLAMAHEGWFRPFV